MKLGHFMCIVFLFCSSTETQSSTDPFVSYYGVDQPAHSRG